MEEQKRMTDRFASTLVIAASIIAAVRLAREDISRPSPRLTSVVNDNPIEELKLSNVEQTRRSYPLGRSRRRTVARSSALDPHHSSVVPAAHSRTAHRVP
jgi:hypothetical protein